MTPLADLLQQGAANAWLFIPSAILLGALHGLEPGHSKTMMAAFIIAVRGTVRQAVLLGLCATLSHTAIVWIIALGGMYLWRGVASETIEPYLQLVSGVIIVGMALWMLSRTWRDQRPAAAHDHGHSHHDHHHDHDHAHDHHHDHQTPREHVLDVAAGGHQDAHERAHADAIERRFSGRPVTTGQIVLFGLTGGLIPCPGAITVLILCLQLQRLALGATLVACFSIGLALTMVAAGVVAALSVRHAASRWSGFDRLITRAPYLSGALILAVGIYMGVQGWLALP
jgi:nickel/cobalt exporter